VKPVPGKPSSQLSYDRSYSDHKLMFLMVQEKLQRAKDTFPDGRKHEEFKDGPPLRLKQAQRSKSQDLRAELILSDFEET